MLNQHISLLGATAQNWWGWEGTRLQEAELLLTQTDDSIGKIARKCGFADPSYFARWIKKHTGRLPRALRAPTTEKSRESDEQDVVPGYVGRNRIG
jgi:transcriptional regulator GlxA family with amidase domain